MTIFDKKNDDSAATESPSRVQPAGLLASWRALRSIRHVRRSVSAKMTLIVLLTTVIALLVAGVGLLFSDLRENRAELARDWQTEADILAMSIAPALSFDDQTSAVRSLSALQARAALRVAALYSADGELYASYVRPGEAEPPPIRPAVAPGTHVRGERIELIRPVVQNGETIGAIYFLAKYDVTGRVTSFARILAVVLVLSLIVAIFAAGWLQGVLTTPIAAVSGVARRIVSGRDYALRVPKHSDDELGVMIDAFNNMLDEVQTRTRALETANDALKREIGGRLIIERALRDSEKLYRAIGESIDYGVWVCDSHGRNTYTSDSFLQLVGITQAECSDFRWAHALHPDDREETIAAWQECVRTGTVWYREHRVRGIDGVYHPILAQGVPIRDELGNITSWAGINLDIERLKQTEQALREADRRKDEFLAVLAHELRNPLAPIRNAARLMSLPNAREDQRTWARDIITRQVRHMALLLDDLLDVSRITRGQLEIKKDYVDLRSVIDTAIESARPLIDAKQHELGVELPATPVRIEADPLRLSQIVSNLLTNAAKYTDPNGRLTLRGQVEGTDLTLSVKDTGIGLRAESIRDIFIMFSQVGSAIDRAEGGLGIGLALVKGLVTLHGGTVEARSEGLGRGSEFIVRLPRVVTAVDEPAPIGDVATSSHGPPTSRIRIVIADDNRDAAATLGAILEISGYEVETVFSGRAALSAGARLRPRAFLLDIGMPDLTGYEVARHIRQEAWGRHAYLVALTGWGQAHDKEAARAAGFDEHLTKPVDPPLLETLLRRALAPEAALPVTTQAPRPATADPPA